ncbi:hypothetical protein [Vulcanisaeta distributa]|uniref:hypothetical protein n=1 Tax=Vulcanisaeta distributa TaxID=164451 RepID=UPI001FB2F3F0|nr:hypothetical protein [Vulcanisaeta distributa]
MIRTTGVVRWGGLRATKANKLVSGLKQAYPGCYCLAYTVVVDGYNVTYVSCPSTAMNSTAT